jgi:hypothetical protein
MTSQAIHTSHLDPGPRVRRAAERGRVDHGWLLSAHTFSFAGYHDPAHMGFRALRVLNDDTVAPGRGFGAHPHRDMEIVSYVLEGALAHRDSLGTGSVIRAGEIQRMSAGTGVVHSELNASAVEPVHFLQIWILPDRLGLAPSYEQRPIPRPEAGQLALIASPDGRAGSVAIHADAAIHAGVIEEGHRAALALAPARSMWVHVARGSVRVAGVDLAAGDGLAISAWPGGGDRPPLEVVGGAGGGEILAIDLA